LRIEADKTRAENNACEVTVSQSDDSWCVTFTYDYGWGLTGPHRADNNKLYDTTTILRSYTVDFQTGTGNKATGNVVYAPDGTDERIEPVNGLGSCGGGLCVDNHDSSGGTSPYGTAFASCVEFPSAPDEYVICRTLP
jgi:hypothetical protein